MDTSLATESFIHNDEEMWFEMVMKCTKFPSVNSLYGINTTNKVVYTLPNVVNFLNELKDQIILTDPRSECKWLTNDKTYYTKFVFILKDNFWIRDVDNMVKEPQDAIFSSLKINDAKIIENHNFKCYKPSMYEYLIIRVGVSKFDYNQFNK